MPRGRSRSTLTRSERIERAIILYQKGYKKADVARKLKIHPDTAATYYEIYLERIETEAKANPDLLSKILENTLRIMQETDVIRREAWQAMERKVMATFECDACGEENRVQSEPSAQSKSALLNTLLKANDQRMKAFGLAGVKQEVFVMFQQVDTVQRAMLEWMARELCPEDREKLARFIEERFPTYLTQTALPAVVEGEVLSDSMDIEMATAGPPRSRD